MCISKKDTLREGDFMKKRERMRERRKTITGAMKDLNKSDL